MKKTTMKTMQSFVVLVLFSLTMAENFDVDFTTANNLFAQSIYKKLATSQDNFLVSPFSAETVLAFAHSGAKGESAEELRQALHLPNDTNKIETAVKTVLPKLRSDGSYSLHTANKLYVQKGYSIKPEFQTAATSVFSADIESVEFGKSVETAKIINKWVEEQTNNKIKNLIDSADLSADARIVLVNALYFKGNWSKQFIPEITQKKDFYKTPNEAKKVDFMHTHQQNFGYYECPHLEAQFVELPFEGDGASMVVVLPNAKDGIANLEKNLGQVFELQHQLQSTYVNVDLPKFKIETMIDFKDILKSLGVHKVFDSSGADLSGIGGVPGELYIEKVAQKTFIDVNEQGVEASAATQLLIFTKSGRLDPPKVFNADHPFIFFIKVKNLVLFAGRVTDPTLS